MKYIVSILFILISLNYTNAQTKILKDNGAWLTLTNKIKISEKISISNVTQQRRVNFLKNTQGFLYSPSINYKISNRVTVGAGFMHYKYFTNGVSHASINKDEYRYYQDVTVNSMLGNFKINNRFRFEERVIDLINANVTPNVIDGSKYVNRFRYRIQATTNLVKLKNNTFILGKLSNETRIRFAGGGINEPDFDQNNFAALLGCKLLTNSTVWIGYGRYYYKIDASHYVSNNILHVNLSYNFDLTKKA
ncbi:DUF2490 domain-containing protein [Lutibacter sp. A80]|uniref:DUF2490 domain-containing protein n=1 Tax=Lutibacter sp. A80 TaxID=2918453 RepID=UPI001F06938E|nr:DUF2490 domain-containing protein [Lutibacter sp. A80]UMB59248.1 DUF2490 domain-containing protein [Lutibacter sp. A80]